MTQPPKRTIAGWLTLIIDGQFGIICCSVDANCGIAGVGKIGRDRGSEIVESHATNSANPAAYTDVNGRTNQSL